MNKRQHLEKAAKCGEESILAIRTAMRRRTEIAPGWEYHEEHAVRMAKLAAWHVFRAKPDLRAPNNYDIAVRNHRQMRRAAKEASR